MNLQEVRAMLRQEKLDRARPWTPISGEYLTAREFLSLIGIYGKKRGYRSTIRWLSMASSRTGGHMPEYLKKCFKDGIVCAHLFQGSPKGAVTFEYRIPIDSLDEKYAERAKTLMFSRNGKSDNSVTLNQRIFRELRVLSARTSRGMSEIVEDLVHKEFESSFAEPHNPASAP